MSNSRNRCGAGRRKLEDQFTGKGKGGSVTTYSPEQLEAFAKERGMEVSTTSQSAPTTEVKPN